MVATKLKKKRVKSTKARFTLGDLDPRRRFSLDDLDLNCPLHRVTYPLSHVDDEQLEDYIDFVTTEMWDVMAACKPDHPYFWPIHNLYCWIEDGVEHQGVRTFVDEVFDGDPSEFVPFFAQALAGMKLLLRAGKGNPAPKVVQQPIVDYLHQSNRPRHLTEIAGMLAHEYDIHIDNARLSVFMSQLQKKKIVRNRMCPVSGSPIERGYWWVDGVKEVQLELNWEGS